MYALKLAPALKEIIWGGTKLITEYGLKTDGSNIAEAWVLSCHKDGNSIVLNGELKDKTLSEAIATFGNDCLGIKGKKFKYFPLLIKLIDAKADLSVQVHPSDEYALKNEGEFGKTEMWYILDAEKDAKLYYGFKNNVSKEEFVNAINNGSLEEILNAVKVKKGDCFYIPAGTIHAIGSGILIAEIQQNSNTTYRVYDYNRTDKDGNKRPLHIEKAIDVTNLTTPPENKMLDKETLCKCDYFTVKKRSVNNSLTSYANEESFLSILCLDGEIEFLNLTLKKGECAFIPANMGEFEIKGNGTIIESRV